MIWTQKQLDAIKSRDKNLLVAAAAGSGKTAVLVERITQLIMSGDFDVDKMLIVTFTNAAAQEMRTRIHKAIAEKLAAVDDSDLIVRLERQAILLSGASIMTFHAFCLSVLRRHFTKINLDPKFREADEHELKILQQEVIEDLFEKKYAEHDAAFIKFTDEFGGNVQGDADLHKLIIKLYDFAQSRPYPNIWLESLTELYEQPDKFKIGEKTWLEAAKKFALDYARGIINYARKECSAIIHKSNELFQSSKGAVKIGQKSLAGDLEIIDTLINATGDWDKFFNSLREIDFIKFDSPRGKLDAEIATAKENIKKRRDNYRDKIENLHEKFVTMTSAEIVDEMKNLAESVRQLVKVTIAFADAFAAAKRERNIIDFNDMEHLALKIFNADDSTAAAYRAKFKVIMVDEYQDTNGVQEEIISKIVGARNFFAVGDVKQSIYRFRNADPEIFLRKYDTYPRAADSERIDLSTNFRSRKKIVDAINAIFEQLMTREAMEIDYDEDARLNFGSNYPVADGTFTERPEFHIINLRDAGKKTYSNDDEETDEYAPDLDKIEREMQLIANRINRMFTAGKQIFDGKDYRPLKYSDIVILLRSIDGTAAKIIDVLRKNKIPAYAADKDGYFRAPEIQTMLSLLRILDNSRQDIPLATVMLSPIGGFSTEDLANLRIDDRKADLYTLISSSEDSRYKNFLDKINRWREMARQLSVPELLSNIYRETGYYNYFGKKVDGKIPQANLRMLIDRAAAYEKTAFRGLSRFIQFIKKIRDLGNDLSAARTLGESENVVHVMTIHKSKGLEFPVVFVAQLGKQFNFQDLRDTVIPHRNLGVGIYRTIEGSNIRTSTFARRVITKKIKAEMLAEELRILYVAFTRAKEKLILVGTVKNDKVLTNFDGLSDLSSNILQSANSPMDWLLMAKNFIGDVINVEVVDAEEINLPADKTDNKIVEEKKIASVEKLPRSPLADIPAKLSVTEMKRRLREEDFEITQWKFDRQKIYRRPNFLQKAELTGAEFGTAMHSVMQHLNLSGDLTANGIVAQIDAMIDNQLLTEEQGAVVRKKSGNIARFFQSEIGRGMLDAQEIYRELPFSQTIAANILKPQIDSAEKIFIQGIIDVLFKDAAGNWILLDYKTDRDNTDEYFQSEYREQINFYTRAVEAIAHVKVAEKYLYLLGAGRFINMNSGD